jgi:hypothetical protein
MIDLIAAVVRALPTLDVREDLIWRFRLGHGVS